MFGMALGMAMNYSLIFKVIVIMLVSFQVKLLDLAAQCFFYKTMTRLTNLQQTTAKIKPKQYKHFPYCFDTTIKHTNI